MNANQYMMKNQKGAWLMKIASQIDWDALPEKFDEFTVLEIETSGKTIKIKSNPGNSSTELRDNSNAEFLGNSSAILYDNSHAILYDNSRAILYGNSYATLRDNSHTELYGNSYAELYEDSHAELRDSSSAVLRGNSHAELYDNSRARLYDNSRARLYDNSRAELRGNSRAKLYEDSHAVLRDNSHTELCENSYAELWDNSSAKLRGNSISRAFSSSITITELNNFATIILQDCSPKIPAHPLTATVIKTKTHQNDIEDFCLLKNLKIVRGNITLYKAVQDDYTDFFSGKIKYTVGKTVTCPDFDPNPNRECGGGLHLSATPEEASKYNKGKILKCRVNKKDVVIYPNNLSKVRCRKVFVVKEVNP